MRGCLKVGGSQDVQGGSIMRNRYISRFFLVFIQNYIYGKSLGRIFNRLGQIGIKLFIGLLSLQGFQNAVSIERKGFYIWV